MMKPVRAALATMSVLEIGNGNRNQSMRLTWTGAATSIRNPDLAVDGNNRNPVCVALSPPPEDSDMAFSRLLLLSVSLPLFATACATDDDVTDDAVIEPGSSF